MAPCPMVKYLSQFWVNIPFSQGWFKIQMVWQYQGQGKKKGGGGNQVWVCFFTMSSAELSSVHSFSRVSSLISVELSLTPRHKFSIAPTNTFRGPRLICCRPGMSQNLVVVLVGISGLSSKKIVFLWENLSLLLYFHKSWAPLHSSSHWTIDNSSI